VQLGHLNVPFDHWTRYIQSQCLYLHAVQHETSRNYKRMEILSFTTLIKLTFRDREILLSKELNVHKIDIVHSFKFTEPYDCNFQDFKSVILHSNIDTVKNQIIKYLIYIIPCN
jgi:hypothetical protein